MTFRYFVIPATVVAALGIGTAGIAGGPDRASANQYPESPQVTEDYPDLEGDSGEGPPNWAADRHRGGNLAQGEIVDNGLRQDSGEGPPNRAAGDPRENVFTAEEQPETPYPDLDKNTGEGPPNPVAPEDRY